MKLEEKTEKSPESHLPKMLHQVIPNPCCNDESNLVETHETRSSSRLYRTHHCRQCGQTRVDIFLTKKD